MGVPSFYKWLVNKYPNTVVNAIEEEGDEAGGVDSSAKNPNEFEFDNLYLDMNGIIHPCFHPEDHPLPPTTFKEVFQNIHNYIDRLFCIVRPRKLLYMAIDGVAPRAKMNQQRSRRFRTSRDNAIADAEERRLRTEFEIAGKPVLPKLESEVTDSNIITPGTQFMDDLSRELKLYINQRLESDAGWRKIKVILSDANVPGEGEHKIMAFIRLQRASPGYDPNTRHCLYGLDADLIMLALATHELHFSILREDILIQDQHPECHSAIETSLNKAEPSLLRCGQLKQRHSAPMKKHYQFLHIWILREYLEVDMTIFEHPSHVKIDLERLIDDFIFMCFFTGNDFLPHMPTLEIHEGAIDLLIHVYVKEFKHLGGYLVDMQWAGYEKGRFVRLKRVEKFALLVGAYEEKIFKKRSEMRDRSLKRLLAQYSNDKEEEEEQERGPDVELQHFAAKGKAPTSQKIGTEAIESSASSTDTSEILQNTRELKEKLKSHIRESSDSFKNGNFMVDRVKLGAIGFKERYYTEKFSAKTKEEIEITRKAVVQRYTEGLCWVCLYYFSEVPSWKWFYPYHYGPFTSDLKGLSQVKVNFQKGSPFKPFDQLMAVLPPRSSHALPRVYRPLMIKEESEIIDFYPVDFEVDQEGKRFTWQGICKLPFIDEECLLSQTKKLEAELEDDEAERNETKNDILFVRSSDEHLGSQIFSLYEKHYEGGETDVHKKSIGTDLGCVLSGFISPCNECPWEYHKGGRENNILFVMYELPNACPHIPRLLEGVNIPEKTITEGDIVETQLWHEYQGTRPNKWFQIQQSHRNATDRANSCLTKSTSGGNYEGAGSGWFGRGKSHNNSSLKTESSWKFPAGRGERLAIPSSSSRVQTRGFITSWDSRGNNAYPVANRGACNLDENWKSSSSSQFEDLRISDSQQGCQSFGRGQTATTDFQSYGNNLVAYRTGYEWRQSSCAQVVGPPVGHGWRPSSSVQGRSTMSMSQHDWQHNLSMRPTPPFQGEGWRQSSGSVPGRSAGSISPHAWRHNLSPSPPPSFQGEGWRQSSGSVQGRAAGSTSQHAWRHNLSSSPTPSFQGQGWRQTSGCVQGRSAGSTSQHAWRNNPSPTFIPSMQAQGRGQFTPNAAPGDQKVRDTPETSSHCKILSLGN